MRIFLAIELPDDVKKAIHEQLQPLESEYRQFSWIPPKNYHITLHFIGEVVNSKDYEKTIEKAIFDCQPFRLFTYGMDLFMRKNILLHVGFHREKALEHLAQKLKSAFEPNEPYLFVPHITVARYKIPSKQQYLLLKKKVNNMEINTEFDVKKITLFESVNGKNFASYRKIYDFELQ